MKKISPKQSIYPQDKMDIKSDQDNTKLSKKTHISKTPRARRSETAKMDHTIILTGDIFKSARTIKAHGELKNQVAAEIMHSSASVGELGAQLITDDKDFSGHLGTLTVSGLLNINERLKQLKINKEKYSVCEDKETKEFYKKQMTNDIAYIAKQGTTTVSGLGANGLNFEIVGQLLPINAKELLDNLAILNKDSEIANIAKKVNGFEDTMDHLLNPVLEILNENVADLIQDIAGPLGSIASTALLGVKDLFDLKKAKNKIKKDDQLPSAESYQIGDEKTLKCIKAAIDLRQSRNAGRKSNLENRLAVGGAKIGILTSGLVATVASGGIAGPIILGCTGVPSIGHAITKGIQTHTSNTKIKSFTQQMEQTEAQLKESKFQLQQLSERITDINKNLTDELDHIPEVDAKLVRLEQLEEMQPSELHHTELRSLTKELNYVLKSQAKVIKFDEECKNLESIIYDLAQEHQELFDKLLERDPRFVAGQLLDSLVQLENAQDKKDMQKFILDYWTRGKPPEDPGTVDKIKMKAGEVAKSGISKAKKLIGGSPEVEKEEVTPEDQLNSAIKNWKSDNDLKRQAAIDVLIHNMEIKQKVGKKLPKKKKEESFLKTSSPLDIE